jgi:type IV pilus assembly protein PilP
MRLLIKLSRLITIVFYIFIWGGCGSEEPPEPQKTTTKKINVKPPATSKENVAQDSGAPPVPEKTVTKKINVKPPTASKENPVQDSGAPPVPSQKPSKPVTSDAKIGVAKKDKTKPKDNSIEKIAPEKDTSELPKEDDIALLDSKPEEPSSLITDNQDSGIETHDPDIESDVEKSLEPETTTSSYDPKGRIDPFVPFIKKTAPKKGPAPQIQRHRGPLEKVDIDQLQLVGIIRAPSGNLALVQLADGKGYIIQKRTPIGDKEGHVVEIFADKVKVEEEGVDSHNEPITKERWMKIKKPIGEL